MTRNRDFYKTLGVDRSATEDEIKRAYRTLAKKYHPDRNPNDASAERSFKEVQEAYATLGNPAKRADYDRFGEVGVGQWSTSPQGQRVYQWGGGSAINVEDLEDLMSAFGGSSGRRASVFEDLFGGRRPRKPQPAPVRGGDETKPISLTFDQAVHGCTITVRLKTGPNGTPETLEVKVPPGVEEGQKIRLPGKGHSGRHGGPPGDLLLIVSLQPHPYFTRRGADIYVDVPITLYEAVLGGTVEVPSLDGKTTVTIPPGTASGRKLRLRGRGIARRGGAERGDQYIEVRIVAPEKLTDEQRSHFQKLRDLDRSDPRAQCPWQGGS